jgi:alpha-tubulin suppressor-like RCC1 family protein
MEDVRTLAVGGGSGTTMAIKKDGSLWAWGANEYGQIGDGTTETRYSPVKIMDDAVAAAIGIEHAMAVKKDGSLWSWGSNENGRIGDGTATVYDAWHIHITEDNERHRPIRVTDGVMLP